MTMRRMILIFLVLTLLCGCAAPQAEYDPYIKVSLVLPNGCSVVSNGQEIRSGTDVEFELVMGEGYAFASVDYTGEYSFEERYGRNYLTLKDVKYPTMAQVTVTSQYCCLDYDPNGAPGEVYSESWDKDVYKRPNTANGTDRFVREGYTLVSWNTKPDGSGTSVGLGSRVTVPGDQLTLYAQWEAWTDPAYFTWEQLDDGIRITGWRGSGDKIVIPGSINGVPVTTVGAQAFCNCEATVVILPQGLVTLEDGAFRDCALEELVMFDDLERIGDDVFINCDNFATLRINAVEAPYGYNYRQESCFANKMDILILAQGQQKIVFYGGCSMWYNLDGQMAQETLGENWQVINMGLNGVINSASQLQILTHYLEDGDIFFHTPEVSSESQMMIRTHMINHDRKLWSGLEYNYDLVSLLDLRTLGEFFDILQYWLSTKIPNSSYKDSFRDSLGNNYVDEYGCASFYRTYNSQSLADKVYLNPDYINADALNLLEQYYRRMQDNGVTIYVSYACLNLNAVPEEQQGNAERIDTLFREGFEKMEGVTVLGSLLDQLYDNTAFYDTNYHLLTATSKENTRYWMTLLVEQMIRDGLWDVAE